MSHSISSFFRQPTLTVVQRLAIKEAFYQAIHTGSRVHNESRPLLFKSLMAGPGCAKRISGNEALPQPISQP